MVRPILRPMFQRMARGSQDPRARMFIGAGLAPLAIDSLTDISQTDITEDITDINVTSKKTTNNNESVGPSQIAINEAKNKEIINNIKFMTQI